MFLMKDIWNLFHNLIGFCVPQWVDSEQGLSRFDNNAALMMLSHQLLLRKMRKMRKELALADEAVAGAECSAGNLINLHTFSDYL